MIRTLADALEALPVDLDAGRANGHVEPRDALAWLEAGRLRVRVLGPLRRFGAGGGSPAFTLALVSVEGEDAPRWVSACRIDGLRIEEPAEPA